MAEGEDELVIRSRVQRASDQHRPTRAEIDLDRIAANFHAIRALAERPVLAVVKCDGYGHGVLPVARRLAAEGAQGFGVALAEEALELRRAGIEGMIVVLNGVFGDAHADVLKAGLSPVVYQLHELERFTAAAAGTPYGIHLKIDTGMSRLGVPVAELDAFLDGFEPWRDRGASIEGVMTHLAAAEDDDAMTTRQLDAFDDALARIAARGHRPRWRHAANSAATLRHPRARYDMVRTGGALWGHPGYDAREAGIGVGLAMRLRTEVVSLRDLPAGAVVGYGSTFVARRQARIAALPVGYGDGLVRFQSNRGHVLIRGQRCPIAGRISMDLTSVDVTDLAEVALGDEAVLLGSQLGETLSVEEVAEACGTIPYEVFTSVSRRVPRFYGPGEVRRDSGDRRTTGVDASAQPGPDKWPSPRQG